MRTIATLTISGALLVSAATAAAQPPGGGTPSEGAAKNAYFGDLHVHTSYSLDAFALGTRTGPRDAYRFARGEPITLDGGRRYRLEVPLDFVAVTDHAEWMGETSLCVLDDKSPVYDGPVCKAVRAMDSDRLAGLPGQRLLAQTVGMMDGEPRRVPEVCSEDGSRCRERAKSVWQEEQRLANEFYEPGRLTTFIAYEWSLTYPGPFGMNHRNVIFRSSHVPATPWSSAEDKRPERLWQWLERNCTGECDVIAIPHNSNWSWGRQLALSNSDGSPFTRDGLALRARAEPLIEIFQHKGSSECMTGLGTSDEQCDYELLWELCPGDETGSCPRQIDYVRNALKNGLVIEDREGVNPFKYGFIASTDTHNATPGATDEEGYPGHMALAEQGAELRLGRTPVLGDESPIRTVRNNPGGLAAVWATENTREAIFDALKRRESFGTSGTRIRIRFFGGWNYPSDLHTRGDLLERAAINGVPMGRNLEPRPSRAVVPRFVAWATQDARGASLQRIQIVKGWVDSARTTHERTYDVVCSGPRTPDPVTHRCPDDGARVKLTDCAIDPTKGSAELATVWTDPAFDPSERAFWYARVLEIPTCRWSTRDAIALAQQPPPDVPPTVQERAWSSPIWYTPATVGAE